MNCTMKTFFKVISSAAILTVAVAPVLVGAQPGVPPWDQPGSPTALFERVFNFLFIVFVVVAAIGLLIAAYFFITAGGNPDGIKKARDFVLYTVIAVVIAAASKIIVWTMYLLVKPGQI